MPKVQSVRRFLERVWQILRQHRSIAWSAGISVVAVVVYCTFGATALNTLSNPSQLSFQAHAGGVYLTPTPTSSPTPTEPAPSSSCSPVAGYEDTDVEAQVLDAVNQARADAGVAALTVDARIHDETLVHSQDMICYGFGHYVPPGTTPASRMAAVGVSFTWHGENIGEAGVGTNLEKAMWLFNTMMAEQPPDDGHRQNILSPNFTITGIGIFVANGDGSLWFTEDFAG